MELKDRLRELRESMGLTQRQFAENIGVSYDNYNKWENGYSPNYRALSKIADYCNTTTDYLLGRTAYKYSPDTQFQVAWENALLPRVINLISDFFIKYNKYKERDNAIILDRVCFNAIIGNLGVTLNGCNELMEQLERIVREDALDDIHATIDSFWEIVFPIQKLARESAPDYFWDGATLPDFEMLIRRGLQARIPSYSEFRKKEMLEKDKVLEEYYKDPAYIDEQKYHDDRMKSLIIDVEAGE